MIEYPKRKSKTHIKGFIDGIWALLLNESSLETELLINCAIYNNYGDKDESEVYRLKKGSKLSEYVLEREFVDSINYYKTPIEIIEQLSYICISKIY